MSSTTDRHLAVSVRPAATGFRPVGRPGGPGPGFRVHSAPRPGRWLTPQSAQAPAGEYCGGVAANRSGIANPASTKEIVMSDTSDDLTFDPAGNARTLEDLLPGLRFLQLYMIRMDLTEPVDSPIDYLMPLLRA